jgi:hypothetical protein
MFGLRRERPSKVQVLKSVHKVVANTADQLPNGGKLGAKYFPHRLVLEKRMPFKLL